MLELHTLYTSLFYHETLANLYLLVFILHFIVDICLGLLVEKTEISGENHQPVASHCQLYQIKNVALNTSLHEWGSNSYI
jgi:hypothetical protein